MAFGSYGNKYAAIIANPNYRKGAALYQQGTSTAPVQHWTQALARVVQGGVGGYQMGKAEKEEKDRAERRRALLAQAVADPANAGRILAQDDDLADRGLGLQIEDSRRKQSWEREDTIRADQNAREDAREQRRMALHAAGLSRAEARERERMEFEAAEKGMTKGPDGKWTRSSPQMPYDGKSMDAQNANILLRGDPNSPEYRAAYAMMGAERVVPDPTTGQMVRIKPDMSAYRPPTNAGYGPPQGQPPVPGAAQPPAGQRPVEPGPGGVAPPPGTKTIDRTGDATYPKVTAETVKKIVEAKQTLGGLKTQLDGIVDKFGKIGTVDKLGGIVGITSEDMAAARASYDMVILTLRDDSLVKTGVLQPAEMVMLQKMVQEPDTLKSIINGDKNAVIQIKGVIDLLNARINAYGQTVPGAAPQLGQQPQPPQPGVPTPQPGAPHPPPPGFIIQGQ